MTMQLRYHPLLTHQGRPTWPPIWISVAPKDPDSEKIVQGEIGHLKQVRYDPTDSRCLFLIIAHDGEEYAGCLLFDDDLSCQKIAQRLRRLYGVAIAAIGRSECLAYLTIEETRHRITEAVLAGVMRTKTCERNATGTSYNKRTILQLILDKIEPGWDILQPSSDEDAETRCFFQRTVEMGDYRQTEAHIPNAYFAVRDLEEIELRVRWALANAN